MTAIGVRSFDLIEVGLPLVRPFRTSFGEEVDKRAILVRVMAETDGDDVEGWGECAASPAPRYSDEWNDGVWSVMTGYLGPALLVDEGRIDRPSDVADRLSFARGHRMSKAALEAAVTDAWLRASGESLASYLGSVRDRIECGVSVGIAPTVDAMIQEIRGYLARGYRRVKLKIEPGRDLEVVRAVRAAVPDTPLSVDANAAYTLEDAPLFEALDDLGLVMIEQPLDHEDLIDHATLQSKLATPICLDESIRSARDAAAAIGLDACRVINIKPGRVGGLLEAKRIHDVARERGVPVWIGGMLETGVGRAANLALAGMPGVTMPGDTSGSDRYFAEDITDPFVVAEDGTIAVPDGPGLGIAPRPERLDACTVRTATIAS